MNKLYILLFIFGFFACKKALVELPVTSSGQTGKIKALENTDERGELQYI
jgi:hypothetical protein